MERRDFLKYVLGSAALLTVAQRAKIEELIAAAPEKKPSRLKWLGITDDWRPAVKTAAELPEGKCDGTMCLVENEDRSYVHVVDVGWVPITTAIAL